MKHLWNENASNEITESKRKIRFEMRLKRQAKQYHNHWLNVEKKLREQQYKQKVEGGLNLDGNRDDEMNATEIYSGWRTGRLCDRIKQLRRGSTKNAFPVVGIKTVGQ